MTVAARMARRREGTEVIQSTSTVQATVSRLLVYGVIELVPNADHRRSSALLRRPREAIAMHREPVVLINAFEVPEGEDDAFLAGWERAREFLSTQEGYLSTRLHRSLSPDAEFRFVNVALWESAHAFREATSQPEFKNAPVPFPFHASLYEVVREGAVA
jgi:heme oxygenase (mycobilin-producing)